MTRLTPDEIRRLPKLARDQITAALAERPTPRRSAGRVDRTAHGDDCSYRCATCGNVEAPGDGRTYAYTRAEAHADTTGHARIEIVLSAPVRR